MSWTGSRLVLRDSLWNRTFFFEGSNFSGVTYMKTDGVRCVFHAVLYNTCPYYDIIIIGNVHLCTKIVIYFPSCRTKPVFLFHKVTIIYGCLLHLVITCFHCIDYSAFVLCCSMHRRNKVMRVSNGMRVNDEVYLAELCVWNRIVWRFFGSDEEDTEKCHTWCMSRKGKFHTMSLFIFLLIIYHSKYAQQW